MALWEFTLAFDDGTVVGQTALGEGDDEPTAAASATRAVAEHPGLVLQRPGFPVAQDVETRWREVCGDRFPGIVPMAGRLALYARGIPDPSIAVEIPPPVRRLSPTRVIACALIVVLGGVLAWRLLTG